MKNTIVLLTIMLMAGCANMTYEQKRNTIIAVGVVVVAGAIVASQDDGSIAINRNCYVLVPPGTVERRAC